MTQTYEQSVGHALRDLYVALKETEASLRMCEAPAGSAAMLYRRDALRLASLALAKAEALTKLLAEPTVEAR